MGESKFWHPWLWNPQAISMKLGIYNYFRDISVIFVNENENVEKRENNEFVNENEKMMKTKTKLKWKNNWQNKNEN